MGNLLKVINKDNRTTLLSLFWCLYSQPYIFDTLYYCLLEDFEQVNGSSEPVLWISIYPGAVGFITLLSSQPAWDVSKISQSDFHWERYLRDPSETSQKIFFFVTSLRRLKYISERCLLCDVFKTSQKHLKKMFFPWCLWNVWKTSVAGVFGFSKIRHKNDL